MSCLTLHDPMNPTPSSSVLHRLPEFAQIHVLWDNDTIDHLILCHSLLLLPSNFPSISVFSKKSVLRIRWPTYWDFSFSISPSNEYSGLIAFTMDGFDLLAGPETLKRLLHQHSLKASVLLCSAFFMVKLSNPYITTEETTLLLTEWTFVGKVVSLHFNKLSWTVISFLPNIN